MSSLDQSIRIPRPAAGGILKEFRPDKREYTGKMPEKVPAPLSEGVSQGLSDLAQAFGGVMPSLIEGAHKQIEKEERAKTANLNYKQLGDYLRKEEQKLVKSGVIPKGTEAYRRIFRHELYGEQNIKDIAKDLELAIYTYSHPESEGHEEFAQELFNKRAPVMGAARRKAAELWPSILENFNKRVLSEKAKRSYALDTKNFQQTVNKLLEYSWKPGKVSYDIANLSPGIPVFDELYHASFLKKNNLGNTDSNKKLAHLNFSLSNIMENRKKMGDGSGFERVKAELVGHIKSYSAAAVAGGNEADIDSLQGMLEGLKSITSGPLAGLRKEKRLFTELDTILDKAETEIQDSDKGSKNHTENNRRMKIATANLIADFKEGGKTIDLSSGSEFMQQLGPILSHIGGDAAALFTLVEAPSLVEKANAIARTLSKEELVEAVKITDDPNWTYEQKESRFIAKFGEAAWYNSTHQKRARRKSQTEDTVAQMVQYSGRIQIIYESAADQMKLFDDFIAAIPSEDDDGRRISLELANFMKSEFQDRLRNLIRDSVEAESSQVEINEKVEAFYETWTENLLGFQDKSQGKVFLDKNKFAYFHIPSKLQESIIKVNSNIQTGYATRVATKESPVVLSKAEVGLTQNMGLILDFEAGHPDTDRDEWQPNTIQRALLIIGGPAIGEKARIAQQSYYQLDPDIEKLHKGTALPDLQEEFGKKLQAKSSRKIEHDEKYRKRYGNKNVIDKGMFVGAQNFFFGAIQGVSEEGETVVDSNGIPVSVQWLTTPEGLRRIGADENLALIPQNERAALVNLDYMTEEQRQAAIAEAESRPVNDLVTDIHKELFRYKGDVPKIKDGLVHGLSVASHPDLVDYRVVAMTTGSELVEGMLALAELNKTTDIKEASDLFTSTIKSVDPESGETKEIPNPALQIPLVKAYLEYRDLVDNPVTLIHFIRGQSEGPGKVTGTTTDRLQSAWSTLWHSGESR